MGIDGDVHSDPVPGADFLRASLLRPLEMILSLMTESGLLVLLELAAERLLSFIATDL